VIKALEELTPTSENVQSRGNAKFLRLDTFFHPRFWEEVLKEINTLQKQLQTLGFLLDIYLSRIVATKHFLMKKG